MDERLKRALEKLLIIKRDIGSALEPILEFIGANLVETIRREGWGPETEGLQHEILNRYLMEEDEDRMQGFAKELEKGLKEWRRGKDQEEARRRRFNREAERIIRQQNEQQKEEDKQKRTARQKR